MYLNKLPEKLQAEYADAVKYFCEKSNINIPQPIAEWTEGGASTASYQVDAELSISLPRELTELLNQFEIDGLCFQLEILTAKELSQVKINWKRRIGLFTKNELLYLLLEFMLAHEPIIPESLLNLINAFSRSEERYSLILLLPPSNVDALKAISTVICAHLEPQLGSESLIRNLLYPIYFGKFLHEKASVLSKECDILRELVRESTLIGCVPPTIQVLVGYGQKIIEQKKAAKSRKSIFQIYKYLTRS